MSAESLMLFWDSVLDHIVGLTRGHFPAVPAYLALERRLLDEMDEHGYTEVPGR